jgi:hypothetical protein
MTLQIGAGINIGSGILVESEFEPGAPTIGAATTTGTTTGIPVLSIFIGQVALPLLHPS